jgi:hypothetical protein
MPLAAPVMTAVLFLKSCMPPSLPFASRLAAAAFPSQQPAEKIT